MLFFLDKNCFRVSWSLYCRYIVGRGRDFDEMGFEVEIKYRIIFGILNNFI